jgi:hypothetical protein
MEQAATKVAIINLSGLFEITIFLNILIFNVSKIWCKGTFFIYKQYEKLFHCLAMKYLLLFI